MSWLIVSSLVLCANAKVTVDQCVRTNQEYLRLDVKEPLLIAHCESVLAVVNTREAWGLADLLILNDIVPFTVLTEPAFLEVGRRDKMIDFVANAILHCSTVACISEVLNREIWNIRSEGPIVFKPAPPNALSSYGVEETWDRGHGSCTAMAVFLITALRFAGVPARLTGVAHWNLGPSLCPDGDASAACGNHNWVEVYDPSSLGWSFIDQRRPDEIVLPLNQSWFYPDWSDHNALPNSLNHSIHAASFLPLDALLDSEYPRGALVEGGTWFPMVWDWADHEVASWDVSAAYKERSEGVEIRVT